MVGSLFPEKLNFLKTFSKFYLKKMKLLNLKTNLKRREAKVKALKVNLHFYRLIFRV